MADYFTGYTNLANPQTSLADMMNLASGVQQYQQAQQINPIALQAKQLELQRLKDTYGASVAQAIAESQKAQTGARVAEAIAPSQISVAGSQAQKAEVDALDSRFKYDSGMHESFAKILDGFRTDPRLKDPKNVTSSDASDIMHEIKVSARTAGIPERTADALTAPGLLTALGKPQQFADYLANTAGATQTALEKRNAVQPTVEVTKEGRTVTNVPGRLPYQTPTVTVGTAGGLQEETPAPSAAPAPKPGVQPLEMGGAFGLSAPVPLTFPKRTTKQYIPLPGEAEAQANGIKLRTALTNGLNNTADMNRNVQESFTAITKLKPDSFYTSGAPGTVVRNVSNLLGSSDYQQLSKDLANLQIAQMQSSGGSLDTDAGKSLQAKAMGTETYNPDVLLNIMQRIDANKTELQLKAPAANLFAQKNGDNNFAKFQQEWSKNADSKVFQAINIFHTVTDPQEQKAQINNLLGFNLPPNATQNQIDAVKKARKLFAEKYDNIQKLITKGSLD